jgi:CheY-like chemotaxis protein
LPNVKLHIVFVEDIPAEAARVEAALRKGGLAFTLQRVDTREAFLRELEFRPPDVILSDHGLPAFDGLSALNLAHQKLPSVPFIFVTNSLTREMEIEKLAPGVTDYVPKKQLDILAPTIRRVLQTAKTSRPGQMSETDRGRILAKLLSLLAEYDVNGVYLPICANCKKIRDKQNRWHPPEVFFRQNLGLEFTHGLCPECSATFFAADAEPPADEPPVKDQPGSRDKS